MSPPSNDAMTMATKRCPVCDVGVKVENLERHLQNLHPRSRVDLASLLTTDERRRVKTAARSPGPAISRRGLKVVGIVAVILAIMLALAILNPFRGPGQQAGAPAPDFTLASSTGGSVTLSALRGKPVLLEFMDVDCPYCQQEASSVLSSLYKGYGSRVQFVSVDANFVGSPDNDDRINAFRATYDTPWTYALDATGAPTGAYGIRATPSTFIIDGNGFILESFKGRAPGGYEDYAGALDRALKG